ncbi:YadA-like family protein [Bradyrhizobium sp. LTSPM299]|uniref:YadA-like family protein n=1 Tax=Bradyrhizobium sp. LTSPM299 TaxID=1619233 RepID=UPI0018CF54BD|nr:YadA-like family protein [Bradyrhizobium sp. LTSPM299]
MDSVQSAISTLSRNAVSGGSSANADKVGKSVASTLGGTTTYDPTTQQVSGFSALVNGTPYSTVTDAIVGVESQISQLGATGPVQYSSAGAPTTPGRAASQDATLVGGTAGAPVRLHNLMVAAPSSTSTDAVNGSQLYATNQDISNLTNSIANGTIGLVRQIGGPNGMITVGAQTGGAPVSVGGTARNRVLTGVAPGAVNARSVDALNGSQLFASVSSVANALGGGSTVNPDGTVSRPAYVVGGKTYGSVGDALTAGTADSIQYDVANGARQNSITLQGGSSGPVAIHNVAAGAAPTDAVNVQQLNDGLASLNQNSRAYTDQRVGQAMALARDAGATSAALAGLNRVDLKTKQGALSMAVGGFSGATAFAVGYDYRLTPVLQVHAGGSFAPNTSATSWNAGASYIFD